MKELKNTSSFIDQAKLTMQTGMRIKEEDTVQKQNVYACTAHFFTKHIKQEKNYVRSNVQEGNIH